MLEISIVIPVYNSASCIKKLHELIKQSVRIEHEIIFINDGSADQSWPVIQELANKDSRVVGINLRKNYGQDNAIMAGFSAIRGRYAVVMDDDLQHSPNDIEALYRKCEEGYDVCYGAFTAKKQSTWKNFGSWLNGKIAEWALGKPKGMYLSPFKIIKKEVIEQFRDFNSPYPYVDGLILSVTDNITQIPIEHQARYAGRSNYSVLRSLAVCGKHVTGFTVLPLRIAIFIGFFSALVGFALMIFYVYDYFTTSHQIEGWTTLVVVNLVMGGLLLIAIGVVGEYVGRSYILLNRKPQYNIKEIVRQQS